jgi:TonB family protein
MNRLQRECLAASLVLHTGLLVLLVVGAGFSSRRPDNTEQVTLLTFIPDKLVDAPVQGGGEPQPPARAVQPPPSQPPVTTPPARQAEPPRVEKPPPKKPVDPKPPEPPAQPKASEPDPPPVSPDGEKPAPKKKIEINLQPTQRSPDQRRADREKAEAAARVEAQRQEEADARRIAEIRQSRFSSALGSLQGGLSSSTSVSVPGTGGATYASYSSFVDLIYRQAWAPLKPRESADRSLTVVARVVIARSGEVVSSEIKRRSGNATLDRSVRAALDRVRTIGRPFPEGARDEQREFEIEFNLESRSAG